MAMTTAEISAAVDAALLEASKDYAGLTFLNDTTIRADIATRLKAAVDEAASD
jgi:hypothetical protein